MLHVHMVPLNNNYVQSYLAHFSHMLSGGMGIKKGNTLYACESMDEPLNFAVSEAKTAL